MMRYILPVATILSLSACANPGGGGGQTTATTIAMMEQALTAAEKAATIYVQLPLCTTTAQRPCSDAAISAKIKTADQTAFEAVKAARASPDDAKTAAAAAALAALVTLLPTN